MEAKRFDEIRSFYDTEVHDVIARLLSNPGFCETINALFPESQLTEQVETMREAKSIEAFQRQVIYPIVRNLADKTTRSLELSGFKYLDKSQSYTYISNHRDIILDSAFLDILLIEKGLNTFEIAIGDNLLAYPWIKDIVRLNRSFIVKRDLSIRQQLIASMELSAYIHHTLHDNNQSIWIAQREGRAKDSDDRTQESVLKMLNLGGTGSVLENLASLQLVPVSISYEYDPCDYLKAREMQLKRDDPAYRKTKADDLLNMQTGIKGFKGRVFYKVTPCISGELLEKDAGMHKNELIEHVAKLIDNRIHLNYHLYPGNYVAADLLDGLDIFSKCYSAKEKDAFVNYLEKQLDKIELPGKDEDFLRKRMLEMYANPLKNKKKAESAL
jgi:Acyltransferase